jgi:hypothetical protein
MWEGWVSVLGSCEQSTSMWTSIRNRRTKLLTGWATISSSRSTVLHRFGYRHSRSVSRSIDFFTQKAVRLTPGFLRLTAYWTVLLAVLQVCRHTDFILTTKNLSPSVFPLILTNLILHLIYIYIYIYIFIYLYIYIKKVKQSRYTPWRRLGGEDV